MTDIVEIHVAFPTLDGAREISHLLLDGGLAASVNIGKEVDTRSVRNGERRRHDEWPLVIRTASVRFEACCETIRRHHAEEKPAIFGFAVTHVDEATAEWIADVTGPDAATAGTDMAGTDMANTTAARI